MNTRLVRIVQAVAAFQAVWWAGIAGAQAIAPVPTVPAKPEPAQAPAAVQPAPEKTPAAAPAQPEGLDGGSMVELLREEAARTMSLLKCDGTRRLLINTSWLPVVSSRTIYVNAKEHTAISEAEFAKLDDAAKAGFAMRIMSPEYYFHTKYGSPLAYARALDLACTEMGCKECFARKRVLDFGYGGIGHLRLLASTGANVVGVEVDPVLKALYSDPQDTGMIAGAGMGDVKPPAGSIQLVQGNWPASSEVAASVGSGFDLIISKNVLKNGYIHPEKPVDPRMLVDLKVTDEAFVKAVAGALNDGGVFVIYNIYPRQSQEKYLPWADGRCPFSKETFVAAGLEVLDFDVDDTIEVRKLGAALRWDEGDGAMDLERDLFARYTIVKRSPK